MKSRKIAVRTRTNPWYHAWEVQPIKRPEIPYGRGMSRGNYQVVIASRIHVNGACDWLAVHRRLTMCFDSYSKTLVFDIVKKYPPVADVFEATAV